MPFVDLLTVCCALVVSVWLASRASPGARVVVGLTAILVSGAMFLPWPVLATIVGVDRVTWLTRHATSLPWSLGELAHFASFLLLAAVLWGLRPDLRGWRALALLAGLAAAAELMQGLGVERSPKLEDVAVNLLGGASGVLLAMLMTRSRRQMSSRLGSDQEDV